mmetsp:Transcript_40764/g.66102  ORF Transcript_40764/g.66102 Transcript_40764/m.66102 type:complete len:207 (-) Transcript_40764:129-749(-)|eukprot:CAMPEP_0184658790 /NCGR_PEP_ID=MMETSP0308-20130426/26906_1 /TAXON_ID=38269 /ORGANISM="Gloeochaete witrockiana, Strain SAG 46.84" /LENGTH=206 /DNA_ID=CAMNT_0027098055 /DNA_START=62 /DNA_END=682 /DNA_ORIENTATION=+
MQKVAARRGAARVKLRELDKVATDESDKENFMTQFRQPNISARDTRKPASKGLRNVKVQNNRLDGWLSSKRSREEDADDLSNLPKKVVKMREEIKDLQATVQELRQRLAESDQDRAALRKQLNHFESQSCPFGNMGTPSDKSMLDMCEQGEDQFVDAEEFFGSCTQIGSTPAKLFGRMSFASDGSPISLTQFPQAKLASPMFDMRF